MCKLKSIKNMCIFYIFFIEIIIEWKEVVLVILLLVVINREYWLKWKKMIRGIFVFFFFSNLSMWKCEIFKYLFMSIDSNI